MNNVRRASDKPSNTRRPLVGLAPSVCASMVGLCVLALIGLSEVGSDVVRLGLALIASVSGVSVIVQLATRPAIELRAVPVIDHER